jgi:molybdopterin-guanine dinucleotide biosynthesis protein A
MDRILSGVILAGGSASRLQGRIKSKIVIDGQTIISRILSVIGDLFAEIFIVTNTPGEFMEYPGCRIIEDEISGAGPLGGIHAAMKASSGDAVFVFAGDMPYLDKSLVEEMVRTYSICGCKALVPSIEGSIEPLHSIYGTSLATQLEIFLSASREMAVRDFLKTIDVHYIQMEASENNNRIFTNINSPRDISAG